MFYRTKSIAQILEPVANQVSHLVLLHEEASSRGSKNNTNHDLGPELEKPVRSVSDAVSNLVAIGEDTINSAKNGDDVLKRDMPKALATIRKAGSDLKNSVTRLRDVSNDQNREEGRHLLLSGCRGILKGTTSMLIVCDDFQIQGIRSECEKLFSLISNNVQHICTLSELSRFVDTFSPLSSSVCSKAESRANDLLDFDRRNELLHSAKQVETLSPILICAIKVYLSSISIKHMSSNNSTASCGESEAKENRNYLTQRLLDEISQIKKVIIDFGHSDIDVEQPPRSVPYQAQSETSTQEPQGRRSRKTSPLSSTSNCSLRHLVGSLTMYGNSTSNEVLQEIETCVSNIIEYIEQRMSDSNLVFERNAFVNTNSILNACESLKERSHLLNGRDLQSIVNMKEAINVLVSNLLLSDPCMIDMSNSVKKFGKSLNDSRTEMSQNVDRLNKDILSVLQSSHVILRLIGSSESSTSVDSMIHSTERLKELMKKLTELCSTTSLSYARHEIETIKNSLVATLDDIKNIMDEALVDDIPTPNAPRDDKVCAQFASSSFMMEAEYLVCQAIDEVEWSSLHTNEQIDRVSAVARISKRMVDILEKLEKTPLAQTLSQKQLIEKLNASIEDFVLSSKSMIESGNNATKSKWRKITDKMLGGIAETVQFFINTSAVSNGFTQNRCKMLEEEINDMSFGENLMSLRLRKDAGVDSRSHGGTPDVLDRSDNHGSRMSQQSSQAERITMPSKDETDANNNAGRGSDTPPPRPPLPKEHLMPGRPPEPDPSMLYGDKHNDGSGIPSNNMKFEKSVHGLCREVKKWDHSDNEIVSTAKKIAYFMAQLLTIVDPESVPGLSSSQLGQHQTSSSRGNTTKKRELLACAKGIAEMSDKLAHLSTQLAMHCADKKIRVNLLQVCEKLPTLGTQLRVLSTVKATMMSDDFGHDSGNFSQSEDDIQAAETLVVNASKLNEATRETVQAAEAASIRVRTDAGFKLQWLRKRSDSIDDDDECEYEVYS